MKRPFRILVTSGGTREPIDGVRFLTNFSTGSTGAGLAGAWAEAGHSVTLLAGEGAVTPDASVEITRYSDFRSLDALLRACLQERDWDLVVHLAAVSDYSVATVDAGQGPRAVDPARKLSSNSESLTLQLKRNFKIVDRLREYAGARAARTVFVGFKLTQDADEPQATERVSQLFAGGGVDWVVHNDLSNWSQAAGRRFRIFGPSRQVRTSANSVPELAGKLMGILEGVEA